jgi:hypothetical protein
MSGLFGKIKAQEISFATVSVGNDLIWERCQSQTK